MVIAAKGFDRGESNHGLETARKRLLGALLLGASATATAEINVGSAAPEFPKGAIWIGAVPEGRP